MLRGMYTAYGLPIEHAWNKLVILNSDGSVQKEMHFDVTMEYVNGYDFYDVIDKEEYVSMFELNYSDVHKCMFDTECYGPWLQKYYEGNETV